MSLDARQQVEIAVSVFERSPTDDEALDALVKAGLADRDAAAMVQLLPMAFGRVLLLEMGIERFEDEFQVKDDRGRVGVVPAVGSAGVLRRDEARARGVLPRRSLTNGVCC